MMNDLLWMLLCSGLVFLMQAGFMCLESGLTRAKNSINVAVKNIADFGISVALFWAFGYGIMFGISSTGWFGTNSFLPSTNNEPFAIAFFLYQAMFCGTASTIISGAVAERLKFSAYLAVVVLVSGIIYPLFGHWAWNDNGWLEQLGFVDFAGSTTVHGVGALVSLATLITIGPRQGRFERLPEGYASRTGKVNKIQGTNLPFAVLGVLLLWVGWLGFNGGSTFAFSDRVPGIILNTVLSGIAGMLAAMLFSQWRYSRIEVEELINGSLAGLVAITACCNFVTTPLAVVIGATGAMVAQLVSQYLKKWRIDDAVDAVAIHGGAGIWGTLCVALFGQLELVDTGLNRLTQLGVQLLGIAVACIWAFGFSWLSLRLLDSFFALRVSPEAEELGLNFSEHQAKTDTYELFQVMDLQARTQDLSLRVPVESFTENGHIATRYNQLMDALEKNHRQSTESLEELYAVTATIVAAVENSRYSPVDFASFAERSDELGILARMLQQIVETISSQQQELDKLENKLEISSLKQQNLIIEILKQRFGKLPQSTIDSIQSVKDTEELEQLIQEAITVDSVNTFSVRF